MIETVHFYRAETHVFEYPLTDPVKTLCAQVCYECGAGKGEVCEDDCLAAATQVWQTHGAIVSCRTHGKPCAFCGELERCEGDVFAVQLPSGGARKYTIRNFGMMALGAFAVYRAYIHEGQWPTGSMANGETIGELPHPTSGGIIGEQDAHH